MQRKVKFTIVSLEIVESILTQKIRIVLRVPLFITEGDSASGSITKARDVQYQAVFSLKGKPLNSFGLTRKVVYENEEFNLIQAALGIEEDLEDLCYNQVVIATDADVDGMHIRLLLITFFLQFFSRTYQTGTSFLFCRLRCSEFGIKNPHYIVMMTQKEKLQSRH